MAKTNEYEITLKYIGKGKKPSYTETDYGFGMNPPIVLRATNKKNAIKKLILPKTVRIKNIKKVNTTGWKRFRSKSYDKAGIMLWEADGGNSKVDVSKFYHSPKPKNWQVQITSKEQARKGYPNSKVGITKKEALKKAHNYMKKYSR